MIQYFIFKTMKTDNKLTMKYRNKKIIVPYCPQCDEDIWGNGSIVLPYKCLCGDWEYNLEDRNYKLKND